LNASRNVDPAIPRAGKYAFERLKSGLAVYVCVLVALAAGLEAAWWRGVIALPGRLAAFPAGISVLLLLLGVYLWKQRRAVCDLQGHVREIERVSHGRINEEKFDQLLQIISRVQHGYRELVDNLDHILFSLSLRGEIVVANRAFGNMLGRAVPDITGHSIEEFLAEPSAEEMRRALPQFLERGVWSGVVRVRFKGTAKARYLDCLLHAVARHGRVTSISGLAADVTYRQELQTRFSRLFDTLHEGVCFSEADGRLLEANPALAGILGYENADEALSLNVYDLFGDAEEREAFRRELEQRGSVANREVTLLRHDGTTRRCLASCVMIRDGQCRPLQLQATFADITERVEMEKRLHHEREFARRLVENSPDAVMVLDTKGKYVFASTRTEDLVGYSPEEVLGVQLGSLMDEGDREAAWQRFRRLVSGEAATADFEYRARHRDGRWVNVQAHAAPLFDARGKIEGIVASFRDVTEAKRLERQMLQAEKVAATGQLIAGFAHELNNPLTAILGASDLIEEAAEEAQTRSHAELIHRQAQRAAGIVQRLLTFARPARPSREKVDIAQIVREALLVHQESLRAAKVQVEFEAPHEVPPVEGDVPQLVQVFGNLIVNAEQAIREARNEGRIRVRIVPEESEVAVLIEDDGPGIPPEILPRIFDPFFTTKRPGGGTGLGLAMSLAIVREHGGTLEAQNGATGAIFRTALPVNERASMARVVSPTIISTGRRKMRKVSNS
jgi:PAS domain S-box-containing protein